MQPRFAYANNGITRELSARAPHTSHQAITIIDEGAAVNDVSGLAKPSNTLVKICVLDKLGSESKAKKN